MVGTRRLSPSADSPPHPLSRHTGPPQVSKKDLSGVFNVSEYVFRLRYQGTTSAEQVQLARRASGLLPVEICRILHAGSLDSTTDMGRLAILSAHDNTILALLAHLGFRDIPIPYFAAHVVFELHMHDGVESPSPARRPSGRGALVVRCTGGVRYQRRLMVPKIKDTYSAAAAGGGGISGGGNSGGGFRFSDCR